jgi:hypothetical protein
MYCKEREDGISKGRFGEVDQILKVGKSKGFWSSEEVYRSLDRNISNLIFSQSLLHFAFIE